jgi:hypothetical protein
VLRLDRDGSVQWQKMLPGQASQRELVAVAALADGGLLLGGKAKSEASAGFDAWVVRTDPKGEILWDTTYAGPGDEEVDTIVALPEGGFVVAGGDFVVAGGDEEEGAPKSGLAWRLDRDGHVLWQKSFGGPRGAITSSTLLPDGGFVLAGLTATSVGTDRGGSVWRLDPDGNLLWQQTIAGPTPGFISAIDKFPDGRFVVAGVSEVNGQMDGAVAILPPSPAPSGDKPQPAVTAPPADKECAKYVASVGKTISVPCAQAGIPTAAPDQPAAAPVAAPPAPPAPGTAKTAELQPPVPPQTAPQDSVGALDAKLQKLAGWSVVKREFPDWYNEQLREAAKLSAANEPEAAVTKHLVEALVALRRQHANEGIAAGAGKLKSVAAAFLANLQALKARSVANCHEFIATGETSPGVIAVVNVPNEGASIQSYLAAVFEAIADGRKSPATHAKASKADYETLVAQLSKLGWNDRDLKVFSNPSALKEESPAHVCQMVTDWFAAHLAITDPGVQERLLADTLKPGFAG